MDRRKSPAAEDEAGQHGLFVRADGGDQPEEILVGGAGEVGLRGLGPCRWDGSGSSR